jgi:hypothetical protein
MVVGEEIFLCLRYSLVPLNTPKGGVLTSMEPLISVVKLHAQSQETVI